MVCPSSLVMAYLPLLFMQLLSAKGFTPALSRTYAVKHRSILGSTSTASHQRVRSSEEEQDTTHNETINRTKLMANIPHERSLYDVLGVSPNATRAELKKTYVALARQSHPDALIGQDQQLVNNTQATELQPDFNEIASAWRVLSNAKSRKRYDRELLAHAFSGEVEKMASQLGTAVAPAAKHVVNKWAMPFMERAATTTMVSISSLSEDWDDSHDVLSAFEAAIKAGKHANKRMDRMSLLSESEVLKVRAAEKTEKAMRLKAKLSSLIDKRLQLALETPNSAISAAESLKILDGLNTIDSITLVDRARRKHRLVHEIESLENAESEYFDKYTHACGAQEHMDDLEGEVLEAQEQAKLDLEAQAEAKRVLEEAQARVMISRSKLHDKAKAFAQAKVTNKRSTSDLERYKGTLQKQQEKVRQALLKKAQDKKKEQDYKDISHVVNGGEEEEGTHLTLDDLRKKEQTLIVTTSRLEGLAEAMLSRADEMKQRADELDKMP